MKTKFLLAEEFRPEVDKKVTVIGLFPGDTIIFSEGPQPTDVPADAPFGMERLSIMVNVSGIQGVHNYKGIVLDPKKQPMGAERPLGDVVIEEGMDHAFIFEMKPFIFRTGGAYTFVLLIDNKPHEFPFEMRFGGQIPE